MKRTLAIASIFVVTACNSLNLENSRTADIGVQYATLKLIQKSDEIDKDSVLKRTALARDLIESGVSFSTLTGKVRESIKWDKLAPEERLLVDALIADILYSVDLDMDVEAPLSAETKARLLVLIERIEQGAAYAE